MFKLRKSTPDKLYQVKYGSAKKIIPRLQWYALAICLCLPLIYWLSLILYNNFYPHADGLLVSEEYLLSAPSDAYVGQIYVNQGQEVKTGANVIQLISPPLESEINTLQQQRVELNHQKAAYINTEISKLIPMKALAAQQISRAQKYYNYIASYRESGAVSLLQMHDAQMELTTAQQSYMAILAQIEQNQRNFAVNRAQVFDNNLRQIELLLALKVKQRQLLLIHSPIIGAIKEIPIHIGEFVPKDKTIAILASKNSFRVIAFVQSKYLSRLKVGNTVRIILPNHSFYPGKIINVPQFTDKIYKGIDLIHETNEQKPIIIIQPGTNFPAQYKINGIQVQILL